MSFLSESLVWQTGSYGELTIWQTDYGKLAYGKTVHGEAMYSRAYPLLILETPHFTVK